MLCDSSHNFEKVFTALKIEKSSFFLFHMTGRVEISSCKNIKAIPTYAFTKQLGLMSLYETMFTQFDITTSQLLVTAFDFTSPERRRNVQYVISQLLALGIVPLLNENDAVSANQGYQTFGNSFSDNDSLASLVAIEMSAQLLILLTDVRGVYDRPPSEPDSKLIDIFNCDKTTFKVGEFFLIFCTVHRYHYSAVLYSMSSCQELYAQCVHAVAALCE
jgi:Amino acid kinase family